MNVSRVNVRLIMFVTVIGLLAFYFRPLVQSVLIGFSATPRAVTARGDLANDEKNTISVFQEVSPSVAYITTIQHVRDFWSRNIMRVPKGTGSGLVWDEHGHVVKKRIKNKRNNGTLQGIGSIIHKIDLSAG